MTIFAIVLFAAVVPVVAFVITGNAVASIIFGIFYGIIFILGLNKLTINHLQHLGLYLLAAMKSGKAVRVYDINNNDDRRW